MAEDENRPLETYSVPVLSADNLVASLNEFFNLQVKKTDLMSRNSETMVSIYSAILSEYYSDLEFITQPRFKDIDRVNEDMEKCIVVVHLTSILKTFLKKINEYDGVSFDDLLEPNFKRSQVILSHLINFKRFQTSREDVAQKFAGRYYLLRKKKDDLISVAPTLQRKVNDIVTDIFEMQKSCNARSQELQHYRNLVKEAVEKKENVQLLLTEKKIKVQNVTREIESDSATQTELQEKSKKLDEKIVSSPQRLPGKMDALKQMLDNNKKELQTVKNKLIETLEHTRNNRVWQGRILILQNQIKSILEELTSVIAKQSEIDSFEHKKQEMRESMAESDLLHKSSLATLHTWMEKYGSLEHQHYVKLNSLRTQLKDAKRSKKRLTSKVSELDIAFDSATEEYNKLDVCMKQCKVDLKSLEKDAQSYLQILASLDVYHGILATYIQDIDIIIDKICRHDVCQEILAMTQQSVRSFDKLAI